MCLIVFKRLVFLIDYRKLFHIEEPLFKLALSLLFFLWKRFINLLNFLGTKVVFGVFKKDSTCLLKCNWDFIPNITSIKICNFQKGVSNRSVGQWFESKEFVRDHLRLSKNGETLILVWNERFYIILYHIITKYSFT